MNQIIRSHSPNQFCQARGKKAKKTCLWPVSLPPPTQFCLTRICAFLSSFVLSQRDTCAMHRIIQKQEKIDRWFLVC